MSIIKNSSISVGFGLLTQALSFVVMPILIRRAGDFAFGEYSQILSYVLICIPLTTLRMEYAFFDKSNKMRDELGFRPICSLIFFTSILLSLCYALGTQDLYKSLIFFALLLSMSIFLFSTQFLIYKNRFIFAGAIRLLDVILFLAFGYFNQLVFSRSASLIIVSVGVVIIYYRSEENTLRNLIRENSRFVKYLVPGHILNGFSREIPTIIIGAKYGLEAGGYFFLIARFFRVPIAIVSNGIGDAIRRDFVGSRLQPKLRRLVLLSLFPASIIAIILALLSRFSLETLFALEFKNYSEYIIPLAFASIFQMVSNTFGNIYIALGLQKIDFYWQVISLLIMLVWITMTHFLNSLSYTAVSLSICWSLSHIINIFLIIRYSAGSRNQ